MAKLKNLKVNPVGYYKLIEKLMELEKSNPGLRIGNKKLSNFTKAISDFEVSTSSIPVETKIAILKTKGFQNPDPVAAPDEKNMSDFAFTDIQYLALTKKLNAIATSHNPQAKKISAFAVKSAAKVKHCIALVAAAASSNV